MTEIELQALISQGEGFRLEFKESTNASLAKELVAFANAKGGRVLIGVDDNGNIKGTVLTNKIRSQIQGISRDCDPPVPMELETVEKEDRVLVINVEEGKNKPYRCTNGFYLREGANSNKRTTDEIYEMFRVAGRFSFDDVICTEADFETYFDPSTLRHFMARIGKEQILSDKETLYNLGALKETEDKTVFTNAGVLFFTKEPTVFHKQALIQCVRYKGNIKIDIEDQKDMNADVISNIQETFVFLRRSLNVAFKIESGNLQREEVWEVPQVALREALVNAIAHKDYTHKGTYSQVEVFDDRVSITNYGGLVEGLTLDDLGKKTAHRNPNLVDLLHRANYIEKLGTGILRINRALEEAGLPKAEFDSSKDWFTISFKRKAKKEIKNAETLKSISDLLDRDVAILKFCIQPKSRAEILKGLLEISNNSKNYNNNVKHLVDLGLLSMTSPDSPTAPNQKYYLSDKGKELLD